MGAAAHARADQEKRRPPGVGVKRHGRWKRTLAGVVGSFALAFCAVGAYVVFPGEPGKASTLTFDGFIKLPGTGPLAALDYLTISRDQLFVSSISSGQVLATSLPALHVQASATVRSSEPGGSAHGVVLVDDPPVGLVTRGGTNTVDLFDPTTLQTLKRLKVAKGPDAILRDPETGLVYVASGEARMASLIDPLQRRVVATIALPGQPEYAAQDARTGLLYQNLADTNSVAVISFVRRAVVDHWPLARCQRPSGMALDALHQRLFVVCSGNSRLGVIDIASHAEIASLPIGRLSDTAAYDPLLQRLYVAGGMGQLTVVVPVGTHAYRVVDRVRTHLGAHTLVIDPASHRLYVGYAGFLGAPRVAVFSPRESTLRQVTTEPK